jgi:NADPH-dependent curcumin reductase CurA
MNLGRERKMSTVPGQIICLYLANEALKSRQKEDSKPEAVVTHVIWIRVKDGKAVRVTSGDPALVAELGIIGMPFETALMKLRNAGWDAKEDLGMIKATR